MYELLVYGHHKINKKVGTALLYMPVNIYLHYVSVECLQLHLTSTASWTCSLILCHSTVPTLLIRMIDSIVRAPHEVKEVQVAHSRVAKALHRINSFRQVLINLNTLLLLLTIAGTYIFTIYSKAGEYILDRTNIWWKIELFLGWNRVFAKCFRFRCHYYPCWVCDNKAWTSR